MHTPSEPAPERPPRLFDVVFAVYVLLMYAAATWWDFIAWASHGSKFVLSGHFFVLETFVQPVVLGGMGLLFCARARLLYAQKRFLAAWLGATVFLLAGLPAARLLAMLQAAYVVRGATVFARPSFWLSSLLALLLLSCKIGAAAELWHWLRPVSEAPARHEKRFAVASIQEKNTAEDFSRGE